MSAAPYAHQLHTKPNILGLNFCLELIRSHLLSPCFDYTAHRMKQHAHFPEPIMRYPIGQKFHSGGSRLILPVFYIAPTAASICLSPSSFGSAASIWLKNSSLVKCLREIASVGHFVLQRPHPLQRTGFTKALFPCFVS
jgi:hypothetical protein